jgi:hypothetical protein
VLVSVIAGGLGAMTALAQHPHPVATAAASVRAELVEVATAPLFAMDSAQTADTLADVEAGEAQLRALKSRLLVHAATLDAPADSGVASTANWLAHRNKLTRREAHRQTRLAKALDAHDLTRDALTQGRVNLEQAEAILRGLDTLPDDLDADLKVRAEEHLLGLAKDHDAKALKHLARTILEVVAPDLADEHLAQQLEKEERDAAAAARFSMWEDGHGKVHGRFTLDALTGAMLKKHLFALAAPKHRAASGPLGERRPTPERLGRRSWSTSSATPPTSSRTPAASTPPSWSSCTSTHCLVGSRPPTSTPATPSPPLWPVAWPARPGSSPPSSAASRRSSTSADNAVSTPGPNASSPPSNKAAASKRAATHHPP